MESILTGFHNAEAGTLVGSLRHAERDAAGKDVTLANILRAFEHEAVLRGADANSRASMRRLLLDLPSAEGDTWMRRLETLLLVRTVSPRARSPPRHAPGAWRRFDSLQSDVSPHRATASTGSRGRHNARNTAGDPAPTASFPLD